MLSINMNTQPIKMEFNSQRASLNLTTTTAQLRLDTEAAKLDIRQPNGELEIDQTSCRYARGIKNVTDFSRDNAQIGKDAAVAAVGRIVEDGNRLANIGSGENAVANMAADSIVSEATEITWTYVPSPEFRYTPQLPQINVTDAKVNNSSQPGSVQGDFNPGQVNINVSQYPSINIYTSEKKVDITV